MFFFLLFIHLIIVIAYMKKYWNSKHDFKFLLDIESNTSFLDKHVLGMLFIKKRTKYIENKWL